MSVALLLTGKHVAGSLLSVQLCLACTPLSHSVLSSCCNKSCCALTSDFDTGLLVVRYLAVTLLNCKVHYKIR